MTDLWAVSGTVATAGATLVALWVALRDGRLRDKERRDSEAAQARLVTVNFEESRKSVEAAIQNLSTQPVLDPIFVSVALIDHEGVRWVLCADDTPEFPVRFGKVLEPSHSVVIAFQRLRAEGDADAVPIPRHIKDDGYRIDMTIQYMDAQGLWWERRNLGQPRRLLVPPEVAVRRIEG